MSLSLRSHQFDERAFKSFHFEKWNRLADKNFQWVSNASAGGRIVGFAQMHNNFANNQRKSLMLMKTVWLSFSKCTWSVVHPSQPKGLPPNEFTEEKETQKKTQLEDIYRLGLSTKVNFSLGDLRPPLVGTKISFQENSLTLRHFSHQQVLKRVFLQIFSFRLG